MNISHGARYLTCCGAHIFSGLVPLYRIQAKEEYELRVDIEDFKGNIAYATYNVFEISSSKDNFRLTVGLYDGNAGVYLLEFLDMSSATRNSSFL